MCTHSKYVSCIYFYFCVPFLSPTLLCIHYYAYVYLQISNTKLHDTSQLTSKLDFNPSVWCCSLCLLQTQTFFKCGEKEHEFKKVSSLYWRRTIFQPSSNGASTCHGKTNRAQLRHITCRFRRVVNGISKAMSPWKKTKKNNT